MEDALKDNGLRMVLPGTARTHTTSPSERWLIIEHHLNGVEPTDIKDMVRRGLRTVERIIQRYESGDSLEPRFGGSVRTLTHAEDVYILHIVEQRPDIYVTTELPTVLRNALGWNVSDAIVYDAVRRLGLTRKMSSHVAAQRSEELRAEFRLFVQLCGGSIIWFFMDESGVGVQTGVRRRAWARRGERALVCTPLSDGRRVTTLTTIGCGGVVLEGLAEGGVNASTYIEYMEVLLPLLPRGAMLVVDNAPIHHAAHVYVKALAEAIGVRLVFSAPYSPDMQPIEIYFGLEKQWLRAHRDEIEHLDLILDPVNAVTEKVRLAREGLAETTDFRAIIRSCGYRV